MNPGFYRSKIIAGSQNHGVNTVHDPFIVGYSSIRFYFGNIHGLYKFLCEVFSVQIFIFIEFFYRAGNFSSHQTFWHIVRKNTHNNLYILFFRREVGMIPGFILKNFCEFFEAGIYKIRTHGIFSFKLAVQLVVIINFSSFILQFYI